MFVVYGKLGIEIINTSWSAVGFAMIDVLVSICVITPFNLFILKYMPWCLGRKKVKVKMISIIIPIYNVEKYLSKCIESLVGQTYKDIEIILINDGSPDHCLSICEQYSKKDNRIIVINQENKGVSAARNAGLKIAKGEYIGFIDPDDWIAVDMYEGLHSVIKQSDVDMVICGYEYYSEDGALDEKRKYPIRENEIINQKEVMNRFLICHLRYAMEL